MADLFRRVIIKGTQQGQNLSAGVFLGSQDDYLIHALEEHLEQEARTISQNEAPISTFIDPAEDGAFWALSTWGDFPIVPEQMGDVTTLAGTEKSKDFWGLSAYRGTISVTGA